MLQRHSQLPTTTSVAPPAILTVACTSEWAGTLATLPLQCVYLCGGYRAVDTVAIVATVATVTAVSTTMSGVSVGWNLMFMPALLWHAVRYLASHVLKCTNDAFTRA